MVYASRGIEMQTLGQVNHDKWTTRITKSMNEDDRFNFIIEKYRNIARISFIVTLLANNVRILENHIDMSCTWLIYLIRFLSSSQRYYVPRAASIVALGSTIGSDPARCRFKATHGVLQRSLSFSPCLPHGRDK
ncbi:PREDICTED: uncharacterized protein LOC105449795 [Wasmannia auropunctata]|uniref:uncharacterized protein LOC105449795 n=1 Tax=Wasmannia auropunctata TaxID=64793 RepID=UPI0005ED562A|nr:PREDICTED: uncharacterized protein LOC105449795 [Wasmannia auropunctata]